MDGKDNVRLMYLLLPIIAFLLFELTGSNKGIVVDIPDGINASTSGRYKNGLGQELHATNKGLLLITKYNRQDVYIDENSGVLPRYSVVNHDTGIIESNVSDEDLSTKGLKAIVKEHRPDIIIHLGVEVVHNTKKVKPVFEDSEKEKKITPRPSNEVRVTFKHWLNLAATDRLDKSIKYVIVDYNVDTKEWEFVIKPIKTIR